MQKRPQPDITPFQARVYKATRRIPKGSVTTYKYLAMAIGCDSCRAVGQALRRNPFAPETPCHRVISSDLSIGGFKGTSQGRMIAEKLALLKNEGILFVNGRLLDTARLYCFGMKLTPRSMGSISKTDATD